MIEKLLENWLDSASERSYQAIFVQMLGARGYNVVHSTRHCALEFGKDIFAVAPDGVVCAYQLKGKPGGRIGLSEFRSEIQPQIIQLMSQPVVFPGLEIGKHQRAYLVSNGYFEEEVQRAIDDLNKAGYFSHLELIGRGQLLQWAKDLGSTLWPSELKDVRELLELFLHDGRDMLPLPRLGSILEEVLALRESDIALKPAELQRAIPSAALLTGIATHQFATSENHVAVMSAWCLFIASALSSLERADQQLSGKARAAVVLAEQAIKDSLVALWEEVKNNPHLVEGHVMAEPELRGWRYTLLCGVLSCLWFLPGDTLEDQERRIALSAWLNRKRAGLSLWGEAAVPSILAYSFFRRRSDATILPDYELASLLKLVVSSNKPGSKAALANPYYNFDEVARNLFGLRAEDRRSKLADETFAGASYSAELLLHLVAISKLKAPCKSVWPDFSRLGHRRFTPAAKWQYCTLKCFEGLEETKQYPSEYQWRKLQEDAMVEGCEYLPSELAARPHLLLLWTIIAPHRMTTQIGRILGATLPTF